MCLVDNYRSERLPAILIKNLELDWVPDDQTLRDWHKDNHQAGRWAERCHVGQLILPTQDGATAMRERILAGESLFELAGKYSIDRLRQKSQ